MHPGHDYEFTGDLAQRFIDIGRAESLRALRRSVLTLAEQRFGDVPTAARGRIETADTETLHRWLARLLRVASLGELLVD